MIVAKATSKDLNDLCDTWWFFSFVFLLGESEVSTVVLFNSLWWSRAVFPVFFFFQSTG